MNNLLRLAYSYRSRARQLRALAAKDSSPRNAEILLTVADNYDEKAAAAEAIEQTHHSFLKNEVDTPQTAIELSASPIWGGDTDRVGKRHIAVLCRSVDEKYQTLIPFIKEAFELGHKAVHSVETGRENDHRNRLAHAGINIAKAEQSGQFELHNDFHLRDGQFDKDRTLASVRKMVEKSRQRGFDKIQAIGNMDWALQAPIIMGDVMEYEARFNEIWPDNGDAAFCVYDLAKFDGATILNVIRTHPMIMIDGMVHDNPHYVPPDKFLQELHSRSTRPIP